MLIRFALFGMLVGAVGCSRTADPRPAPAPGTPGQEPAAKTDTTQPKTGAAGDSGARDRVIRYVDKVGGQYRFENLGEGEFVSHIYLTGTGATDTGVREILPPTLWSIDFGPTPVTDGTLRQ